MSCSVKQYLDLYDESANLLGRRDAERDALEHAGSLDDAFASESYGMNLQRLALQVDVARSLRCSVPSVTTLPAAVVNDIFAAPERLASQLPAGVKLMSLRAAVRTCPELIPGFSGGIDDAETRLNDLLWSDGVLLSVAPGIKLDRPLQLVNIFSAPMDLMAVRRLIVSIGEGSDARLLVCDHTQDSERRYLSSELIRVSVGRNARFGLDFIEESSALTVRRSTLDCRLDEHALFECTAATLSCGDTRMRIFADLNGQGARAVVNGMVIADREQRAAFATRVAHHAENTSSNQLFKFVADGQSRCAYDGRIIVDECARFTEAYQTNRNLLASDSAVMHTEPALEIYCDEVKCSHGAATGQLDERALFYMRQRGIEESIARRMLMEAFVGDVIDTVHIEALRERLRHLVERRFSGLGSDVATCADCNIKRDNSDCDGA